MYWRKRCEQSKHDQVCTGLGSKARNIPGLWGRGKHLAFWTVTGIIGFLQYKITVNCTENISGKRHCVQAKDAFQGRMFSLKEPTLPADWNNTLHKIHPFRRTVQLHMGMCGRTAGTNMGLMFLSSPSSWFHPTNKKMFWIVMEVNLGLALS